MNIAKFRRATGFSLVEIMVGLTVGLITVLVVMQVLQVAETRKRSSTSGTDAVVNAALGLYTIERDGKNAGYGMTTVQTSVGCPIRAQHGSTTRDFNLVPVKIGDQPNGAPDEIQFLASNKNGVTLPSRIAVEHPRVATNFFVESDLGVEEGDLMIAVPSVLTNATWCSLFQVTSTGGASSGTGNGNGNAQGQNQVVHNSGESEWNQPGNSIFPSAGYMPGDHLINLGSFLDHTFSITGTGTKYLHLKNYRMQTDDTDELDLYPNVVQLQAVYGKDTDIPRDNRVNAWNATAPTTPTEWQQVIAVRVALVSRSQFPEPGVVTLDGADAASTCDSTAPHPAAVCWKPDPNGNGVKINVAADNPNWQRYRYRVVETTIPLRNAIWRQ